MGILEEIIRQRNRDDRIKAVALMAAATSMQGIHHTASQVMERADIFEVHLRKSDKNIFENEQEA